MAALAQVELNGAGHAPAHQRTVRLARERTSAQYDVILSPTAVVVIGDTVLDIEAALGTGARAIGVATGQTTAGDLSSAGAHVVLTDLTSVDDLVTAAYGPTSRD